MRRIICFILLIICMHVIASNKKFSLKEIVVECLHSDSCSRYKKAMKEIQGKKITLDALKNRIDMLSTEEVINGIYYSVDKVGTKDISVKVNLNLKKQIQKIIFKSNYGVDLTSLKKFFIYKEGGHYDKYLKRESVTQIKKYLKERGVLISTVNITTEPMGDKLSIIYDIKIENAKKVKDIHIESKNIELSKEIQRVLSKFKNKLFDKNNFKNSLDVLTLSIFEEGYYNINISHKITKLDKDKIRISIQVKDGRKYGFYFQNINVFSRKQLIEEIQNSVRNNLGNINEKIIVNTIDDFYKKNGVFQTKINFRKVAGVGKKGIGYVHYFVNVIEGKRTRVSKIKFIGNEHFSDREILEIYDEFSTVLASRDYYDEQYVDQFIKNLKQRYNEEGFVLTDVNYIKKKDKKRKNRFSIEFSIKERARCFIDSIDLIGVSETLKKKILKEIKNQERKAFNAPYLQEDINKILMLIREEGYYYAILKKIKMEDLLSYDSNFEKVKITIPVLLGEKLFLNELVVVGNLKTKTRIILRELDLRKNEIITPQRIQKAKDKISYLGLFSQIKVTPLVTSEKIDLTREYVNVLINVIERDYGLVEIAPGYRTDIGLKVSSAVSYGNISGMNRSASLKAQTNHRLNLSTLDDRRRREDKKKIEYDASAIFTEPYLLGLPLEFESVISNSSKRFYAFDAKISKTALKLNKSWGNHFLTSMKYQLETIRQKDATDAKDSGYFRIGGITPYLNLDFRDNKLNPRKGYFLGVSCEFANPTFFSMDKEDIEINFYKLTVRNKAYFSYKNTVFALLLSGGIEKNLVSRKYYYNERGEKQTRGYIPSVKVFRLNGIDVVRGFGDNEINRIDMQDSPDISELQVDNKVYFLNLKFEPRYYVNDNFVAGIFFDAGKLHVNHLKPLKLRTSIGGTLKFLTPIGSLNFDYGVKLHRKSFQGEKKDSFGRFHLSIGYF